MKTQLIGGKIDRGQSVRAQNLSACMSLCNVVKSSLGPVGLDKMIVNEIGEVTVTNDGATILKLIEVQHPAAKILVEIASLQDMEVGDGTTSVVIIASELLQRGNNLINQQIHPKVVIEGYRLALKESCEFIEKRLKICTDSLGKDCLFHCANTSINSKFIGMEKEFFADMAVKAILMIKDIDRYTGNPIYNLKSINQLKINGSSILESKLLPGCGILMGRAAQGMPNSITHAKIACLDFDLRKSRMQMGVSILVTDPCELEQIRERESDILKHRIEKILAAGANVVLTTKGIDDMAQKYFVEAGVIACRRVPLEDIQQVAKATGSDIILTMADNDGEESFTASQLGYAELVYEDQISSSEIIVFQGCKMNRVATLLLRGADHQMLEELERSLNDAFCVIKKVLEGRTVVPGGGTVETVLPIHLESYATTMGSREQLAVTEFADALLVIPITLAVNAAKDATELVANLLSYNYTYFLINTSIDKPKSAPFGLDLVKGDICNNLDIGVIEPSISKIKMLQFATEAAITILRIDDYIKPDSKPKEPTRK